jgi:outer membrane protein TolC
MTQLLLTLVSALALSTAQAAQPAPVVADLSLSDALQRLSDDSPMLAEVHGRVDEAQAGARMASVGVQPMVVATGGFAVNNAEAIVSMADILSSLPVPVDPATLPDDLIIQPKQQWTGGLSAKVPLIVPSAWASRTAARRGVTAAEAGADAAELTAQAGLVRAAWGAWVADEQVAVLGAALESSRAHHDSVARRTEAGLGTPLDVLAAETEVLRREREWLGAIAQLDGARRAVGGLLGVDGPVRIAVPDVERLPSLGTSSASEHPQVRVSEAQQSAARAASHAAVWRHAPTLSASGALMASDVAYPTGETTFWRVGLDLNWVLYDGGARYGLAERAAAQRTQAEASGRRVALDLSRALADAEQAEATALQTLALAQSGARTAAVAEDTATRLYEGGLARSLDVLDAQQRRLESDLALAGATAAVATARVDRLLAMGQPWPTP